MRNKKMKPVWRLNIGRGVPEGLGGEIMFGDGVICPSDGYGDNAVACLWSIDGGVCDVYAYQTNRFKEAKRGN